MQAILYKSKAEKIRVIKSDLLLFPLPINGTLREANSILTPKLVVQGTTETPVVVLMGYNYVFIADFNRYYFVEDIVVLNNNLVEFRLKVDVLMSFKSYIGGTTALISRNEFEYNKYIKDQLMVFDTNYTIEEREFQTPSGQYPHYIDFDTLNVDGQIAGFNVVVCCSTTFDWEGYYLGLGKSIRQIKPIIEAPFDGLPKINGNAFPQLGSDVYYVMGVDDLMKILNEIMTPSNTSMSANELISTFIKSITIYPFDLPINLAISGVGQHYLRIGNVEINGVIGNFPRYTSSVGYLVNNTFKIDPKFNDYRDFSPYSKHEIYLPYVGYVEVDPNLILNTESNPCTLGVVYNIDLNTGGATATLINIENGVIIHRSQCQLGIQIGTTQTNALELTRAKQANTANMYASMAMTTTMALGSMVASGGTMLPVMMGMTLASGFGQALTNMIGREIQMISQAQANISSGNDGLYAPTQVKYRLSYLKKSMGNMALYNHTYGIPLFRQRRLMDMCGFTSCEEVHLENFPTATESELNEIEKLLKSGVILPNPN